MINKTLIQLYHEHGGKVSDKWSLNLSTYDRLFSPLRTCEINLLEIGIQNGGSLEIWAKYFVKANKLVGCDINPDCQLLSYVDKRISIVIGNANLESTEKSIISFERNYDLIIDDGSHQSSDIIKSFVRYFPHLAVGGIFVVEDLHCSYWHEFEGGLFAPFSSMAFFKRLADVVNHEHWGIDSTRKELLADFSNHYQLLFDENILSYIHSVEFVNSTCVVRKFSSEKNEAGLRCVVGSEELVASEVKAFNSTVSQALDQSQNIWSKLPLSVENHLTSLFGDPAQSDAQFVNLEQTVVTQGRQIVQLTQVMLEREAQIVGLNQTVGDQDHRIIRLLHTLLERDTQIEGLNQTVVNQDGQIVHTVLERDARIDDLNKAAVAQDEQIVRFVHTLSQLNAQITCLNLVAGDQKEQIVRLVNDVLGREEQVANLNAQQFMLNTELLKLNTERATFGAAVGRKITKLRARAAPVGTLRGSFVQLAAKFTFTLVSSGLNATVAKSYRFIASRTRSKIIRLRNFQNLESSVTGLHGANETYAAAAKMQADHPQLNAWIEKNEPTHDQLASQSTAATAFKYKPLLSVIVPVYKVPRYVLDETLASLEQQSYPNWEACIVWSDIDDKSGWDWLKIRGGKDRRFKLKKLAANEGISGNSNLALKLAEGEFVALLDHDDTVAPWAFFEIVNLLQVSPDLDFIYSDKDSITADGQIRLNALFKPEWSPEMLHSVNYLTHLNVIRTSIIKEIGGWRTATDGAQDWDLFFRVTERTQRIARVPCILYHWRILPTSTATGLAAKPYAALGQLKSQQDYFLRRGLSASVVPTSEGLFKVGWPLHEKSTDIVVFQSGTLTQLVTVLDSLRLVKQGGIRCIHVVHSTPATNALNAFTTVWLGRIRFTHIKSANWQTALVEALIGDIVETILILDGCATGLSETMVEELSGWVAQHPDIAWASAISVNLDGTVYEAGRVVSADHQSAPMFSGSPLFSFGWFGGPLWYRNARACSPYAVAIRGSDASSVLSKAVVFDGSRNGFVAFCLELSATGRRGLIDPFAKVYFSKPPEKSWPNDGIPFHVDPYFNPAFDQVSPLRLK